MDQICRLCCKKSTNSSSIFSFHNNRLISDIVTLLCPVRISPADSLPKLICPRCLKIVSDAYELREESVRSDINFRTGKFKPQEEAPKIVEIRKEPTTSSAISIKVEEDPFVRPVEFVDESQDDDAMENEYEEESYEDTNDMDYEDIMIPLDPQLKKTKYDHRQGKYQCPHCPKAFTYMTNVRRHIKHMHTGKKIPYKVYSSSGSSNKGHKSNPAKPKDVQSARCHICDAYISHATNLKRHIKTHHPDHVANYEQFTPITHTQPAKVIQIKSSPSDLTKKFFGNGRKQKYLPYISVVSQESETSFTFECLLCRKQNNCSKTWMQSLQNGGTSNVRRHLSTMHENEFFQLEGLDADDNND